MDTNMTSCGDVVEYQRFEGSCCPPEEGRPPPAFSSPWKSQVSRECTSWTARQPETWSPFLIINTLNRYLERQGTGCSLRHTTARGHDTLLPGDR